MAVPGRNRTLLCCTFPLHYHVRSTVTHNWGSYVLCKCVKYSWVYTASMSPTRNEVLLYSTQTWWCNWNVQQNNVQFLPGTATHVAVPGRNRLPHSHVVVQPVGNSTHLSVTLVMWARVHYTVSIHKCNHTILLSNLLLSQWVHPQ